MKQPVVESSSSLRDAMVGFGLALGGGGLLVAAVLHLAAPIVVFTMPLAPPPGESGTHAAAPAAREAVADFAGPTTAARREGRARIGRDARPQARLAGSHDPTTARHAADHHPDTARTVSPVARASVAKRASAPPHAGSAQRSTVAKATSFVNPSSARHASVATTTAPSSKTSSKRTPPERARRSGGSAAYRAAVIAPGAPRAFGRKPRGTRRADPNATPEPPVGFDERPSLVEAPLGSPLDDANAADARFGGIRVRGRALVSPTAAPTRAPSETGADRGIASDGRRP